MMVAISKSITRMKETARGQREEIYSMEGVGAYTHTRMHADTGLCGANLRIHGLCVVLYVYIRMYIHTYVRTYVPVSILGFQVCMDYLQYSCDNLRLCG